MYHLFDEIESTSTTAQEFIQDGIQPPFIIQALSQTKGRGQVGRVWDSPKGHLFLSIAVPLSPLDNKYLGLLSLAFGGWVVNWLESKLGIVFTLKWPNDIYFGGGKLGGILCETSVSGETITHAIVGIGINLESRLGEEGGLRTIGLQNIVPDALSATELGKELGFFLVGCLTPGWHRQVRQRFMQYTFPVGTGVQVEGRGYYFKDIAEDGGLIIQNNRGGEMTLTSGRNKISWSPIANDQVFGVADFGNTALKVGVFQGSAHHAKWEGRALWTDVSSLLPSLADQLTHPKVIFCGSVFPGGMKALENWADTEGVKLCEVPKRKVRIQTTYPLDQLGFDRLAAMEAAVARYPKKKLIVVSLGTATTIDVVDDAANHLGGYILAGIQTQLDALGQKGALLPNLDFSRTRATGELGFNTEASIINGVVFSVERMLASLLDQYDLEMCHLVLTGGLAHAIRLEEALRFPSAVLHGIREIVVGGSIELLPE